MDGGSVEGVYNLIPLDNIFPCDHPCLRFPEVQAAINALRDLTQGHHHDLLDRLADLFGFQADNVRNQREHLVLHLANLHMRRDSPAVDNPSSLDPGILKDYCNKLLENYEEWCAYLGVASNVVSCDNRHLAYISLYLLIWGESANLRFLPECICFIFHNMAMELNLILDEEQLHCPPARRKEFLYEVVKPIYDAMSSEVEKGREGIGQFVKWRNYDDFNEYFWSNRCFHDLKWPLDRSSKFFDGAGKTGFVERRSFWNLFRSFSRLWVMLVLFLQGAVIVAWEEKKNPFESLSDMDVKVRVLTVFVTWSCLDLLESVLDILMQYKLVSSYTLSLGIRMLAKLLVSITWTTTFGWLYVEIWVTRNKDDDDSIWSPEANRQVSRFLKVAVAFVTLRIWLFVQSFLPFISHFLNKKRWTILMLFRKRLFIGRGLREGMWDYTKYSTFWILVLVSKFYFSYTLQILPMVNCTKQLWNLKGVDYKLWHQILDERNVAAIALLWLPVILIYLMDLQFWFSIWSFLFSPAIGLFSRLGEIQHIRQLKLRFGDFVRQVAYKFDLVTGEHECPCWTRFRFGWSKMKNQRRASSPQIKNLESKPELVQKFSVLWNEIIASFREEDIISDVEFELLEMPRNDWSMRVICWPCFLLCNQLDEAIRVATELQLRNDATDTKLWNKICQNEYRRTAVIEVYDGVRYLLLNCIIDSRTDEHDMVDKLFKVLDHSLEDQKFIQEFDLSRLGSIRNWIIEFLYTLIAPDAHRWSIARALQKLYIAVVIDFIKDFEKKNNLQPKPNESPFMGEESFLIKMRHWSVAC